MSWLSSSCELAYWLLCPILPNGLGGQMEHEYGLQRPGMTRSKCVLQVVKGTGALYLEAPVSGSKQPAEKGQLIFLCGGDKELYEQATPLLKVMGKAQFFLGEVCCEQPSISNQLLHWIASVQLKSLSQQQSLIGLHLYSAVCA